MIRNLCSQKCNTLWYRMVISTQLIHPCNIFIFSYWNEQFHYVNSAKSTVVANTFTKPSLKSVGFASDKVSMYYNSHSMLRSQMQLKKHHLWSSLPMQFNCPFNITSSYPDKHWHCGPFTPSMHMEDWGQSIKSHSTAKTKSTLSISGMSRAYIRTWEFSNLHSARSKETGSAHGL